jgi:threonine dehydrogenase-like Zn-dependent dehydrogenase
MFDEITIIGTRIYQHRDIEDAINLVYSRKLDAHSLISKIYPLEEAATAIHSLRSGEEMKVLIKPGGAQNTLQA